MKKSVPTRSQVNVRLRAYHIEIMNRACVVMDKTQGEVIEKALEMLAARKRIVLPETKDKVS